MRFQIEQLTSFFAGESFLGSVTFYHPQGTIVLVCETCNIWICFLSLCCQIDKCVFLICLCSVYLHVFFFSQCMILLKAEKRAIKKIELKMSEDA